ncbi:DUF7344 domain-containing protein [Halopelagius inordinatus]|nr:permease [Halopelagius inordinatus]
MSDSTSGENDESMSDFRGASETRLDVLFGVLAKRRRRVALRCLVAYDTPMTLADLADEVAVREREATLAQIPADDVMQVYLSLYHAHVPKLGDAGFVEYSQEQDLVRLTEEPDRIRRLLDAAPTEE